MKIKKLITSTVISILLLNLSIGVFAASEVDTSQFSEQEIRYSTATLCSGDLGTARR